MSNAMNPFSLVAIGTLSVLLASCSPIAWSTSEQDFHPYLSDAKEVVAKIEVHTKLPSQCRSVATSIVASGIALRLATTRADLHHAAIGHASAGIKWENNDCPPAAVPGLSFGAADGASNIGNRAHKSAGLR